LRKLLLAQHRGSVESLLTILPSGDDYVRYPLIGGGSVLVIEDKSDLMKFIDFGNFSGKKVVAIAVDEDSTN